jgi:CSLREA domain-containing protein
MNRPTLSRTIAILLPFFVAATAGATVRTVTNLSDSGAGSLRDTIAACGDGDTIVFSVTGQIQLTTGTLTITHPISIFGPGANLLEVTRTLGAFRIFSVQASLTITAISITNGTAAGNLDYGGAINSTSGTLTLTNCTLSGNSATFGGGAIVASNAIISGCTFSNNSAVDGGAIDFADGKMNVASSTFTGNHSSGNGGAITNNNHGELTIVDCVFSQNTAPLGGAIFNDGFGSAVFSTTVQDSTFNGNGSSCQNGGAIGGRFGKLTLKSCTLSNNTSSVSGGGIYYDNGRVSLRNCTLSKNSSQTGGGIYNVGNGSAFASTVDIGSCTFSENSAPNGGGIYNTGTSGGNAFVTLANTILFSSNSTPGANLINDGLGTSISSKGYNLSSDNGGGFLTATGDQINTDPKLGPLKDNGGPTPTMALLAGSPAQDKGNRFDVENDQRGLVRPVDVTGISNLADGSDIGAVEMSNVPPFIVTTTADHDDGNCNASDCTLREAINAANVQGGPDTILFANGLKGAITLQLALGPLTVTDSVEILGPGAHVLAVSGNEDLRVFTFSAGTSFIAALTIRDGWLAGNSGDGASRFGGGIYNHGTLSVFECTFSNNFVSGANNLSNGAKGGDGRGAAIFNDGNLALNFSTFGPSGPYSANVVSGGGGAPNTAQFGVGGTGGAGQGGAVFNSGTLLAANCTFEGNGAVGAGGGPDTNFAGGPGGEGSGGAIYNSGAMTLIACTISGNQGAGGSGGQGKSSFNNGAPGLGNGGVKTSGGSATVENTIIAVNTGNHGGAPDVDGAFSSGGYNLLGSRDHSTGFTATGDLGGTDSALLNPVLDSLKDNGGGTDTMALLPGSPALDRGNAFGEFSDQHGQLRTVDLSNAGEPPPGDGTDIGAFEVQATSPTRLANVATRLKVEAGDNVLFGGFIVTGSQPKKVIVRALGPSVQAPGVLADPTLELYQGNTLLESNDNWVDSPNKQAIIDSTVQPPNNLEAAIVRSLPGNNSVYTAIVRGANNSTGIGIVEVYDLDNSVDSKLANISTRGPVQTGDDVLIAGTIITGQAAERILVCALGPSVAVPGNLADPTLELRDGSGTLLEANDNWVDSPNKQAIMNSGAPPTNNLESAIIHTVSANGAIYTAIVRGVNNSTGVAVVEVFALN